MDQFARDHRAPSVRDVLGQLEEPGNGHRGPAVETGFRPLDEVLTGGLRPGDLTLVGGAPGVGKTVATLQWARNVARAGGTAIYACYEHDEQDLLLRLLALESAEAALDQGEGADEDLEKLRRRVQDAMVGGRPLEELLESSALLRGARAVVGDYADRLLLLRASGAYTGVLELDSVLPQERSGPVVLFVDYLQKVSLRPEPPIEDDKVTRVTEALKELALSRAIPVVAVVAADRVGLRAPRLRLHHLRGSSALAFESDVVIMLNEKAAAVSKVHLAYSPLQAEQFRRWVVFSIEKNRGGPNRLDLEFRKDFASFRFEPEGGFVRERLVDERFEEH